MRFNAYHQPWGVMRGFAPAIEIALPKGHPAPSADRPPAWTADSFRPRRWTIGGTPHRRGFNRRPMVCKSVQHTLSPDPHTNTTAPMLYSFAIRGILLVEYLVYVGRNPFPVPTMDDGAIVYRPSSGKPATNFRVSALVK